MHEVMSCPSVFPYIALVNERLTWHTVLSHNINRNCCLYSIGKLTINALF